MEDLIIDVLSYSIPSVVTGFVAYYFFLRLSTSEDSKNKFELFKEDKKNVLPVRLQAYERLTLVMERVNPSKLLIRITPTSDDKELYVQKLITCIEQEFEHNLSQQIYVSDDCWSALVAAKNSTNNIVTATAKETQIETSHNLREEILQKMIKSSAPSQTGIAFIKEEVRQLF